MPKAVKLIVVKAHQYAEGYVVCKQIGAEVYEPLSDYEASLCGLVDNQPRELGKSMTRLLQAARACAAGAPWAIPKRGAQ